MTIAKENMHQIQKAQPKPSEVLESYYVQIDNFLTLEERSRLLEYVLKQELAFVPSSSSKGKGTPRRSIILHSFPEFSELMVNRIEAILPDVISELGLPPFSVSKIETQLTAHNDGDYFKIHNDNGSPEVATREISYVYYFYREPKSFSCGELLLYDIHKLKNNFYVKAESFKTIEPRNNSIVFFPSHCLHEVLSVSCPSKAFADSRFTINGWIHC